MGNFHQDGLTLPPKQHPKFHKTTVSRALASGSKGPGSPSDRSQGGRSSRSLLEVVSGLRSGRGDWAEPSDYRVAAGTWHHLSAGQRTEGESCTDRCLGHLQTVPSGADHTHVRSGEATCGWTAGTSTWGAHRTENGICSHQPD